MATPARAQQPRIELVVLGVGAGATHVYSGQASSSFAVLVGSEPVLLADCGHGVVAAALGLLGCVPRNLYVSHNHTDHAGDLPVALGVECKGAQRLRLYAHPGVMTRLRNHRLAELKSTGNELEHFAEFIGAPDSGEGGRTPISGTCLSVETLRTRHSELCYGFRLYCTAGEREHLLLGWTADSAYDPELYNALAEAPLMLVDARRQATGEHATFEEVEELVRREPFTSKALYVTGYGRLDEAPAAGAPFTTALPGMRILLQAGGG